MLTAEEMEPAGHVHVNAGRLWAGGVATAIVAALAVLAGVLITRGVLGIPVLAPKAASSARCSAAWRSVSSWACSWAIAAGS